MYSQYPHKYINLNIWATLFMKDVFFVSAIKFSVKFAITFCIKFSKYI